MNRSAYQVLQKPIVTEKSLTARDGRVELTVDASNVGLTTNAERRACTGSHLAITRSKSVVFNGGPIETRLGGGR